MVQVTTTHRQEMPGAGYYPYGQSYAGQGTPTIHVHHVERYIHGNGVCLKSYGEILIASGEFVWAHELKMNTIQVLLLTPEPGRNTGQGYMAQVSIWHKGEYDNYASIDIYDHNGNWINPGRTAGPTNGSIWLDYEALGE